VPHTPSPETIRKTWPEPAKGKPVSPPAPEPGESDVKDSPGD